MSASNDQQSGPRKIAVVGANGFVGSRVVEMFHLGDGVEVVPVVRSVTGLPRLSRFDLEWRFADAQDADGLADALKGCEAVVHSVVGDPKVIEAAAKALLPAANKAGIRRVVYLSTASVHGQNPQPGTSEDSPLNDSQPIEYNNAKIRAERTLLAARKTGATELAMLRPSVVFGPRDRWVTKLVAELRSGTAWLLNDGQGVCNSIYVDNLVHAIRLALRRPAADVDGRAFLVGDNEAVSWADFYSTAANGLGFDPGGIHRISAPNFPEPGIAAKLGRLKSSSPVQAVLPIIPAGLKKGVKGFLAGWTARPPESSWRLPRPASQSPSPSPEMVALQQCAYRLPDALAREKLGYAAPVAFGEGMRRTLAWLEWAR